MTVANILKSKGSTHVETIGPMAPVLEAARRLAEKRFGSLVVADGDGTPIGILS
jgi:CBS domain-containing protein